MVKLTDWQMKALHHIGNANDHGLGAIMPYHELIKAANEVTDMGLAEDRGGTDRRWLLPAGRAALANGDEGK